MPEHFTRNTVSASFFCNKCGKFTQHRIDDARKGPCLDCIARLEQQHKQATAKPICPLCGEVQSNNGFIAWCESGHVFSIEGEPAKQGDLFQ